MFIIQDNINEIDYENVYYAYVRFFADLYGTITPNSAMNAIKQVNEEHLLKVLTLYDKNNNLIAISRFRVLNDELITSDIICIHNESLERKKIIYQAMISYLEDLAIKNNLNTSFLEVPKFDMVLSLTAEQSGYAFSESDKKNNSKYVRTLLMDKKLKELESEVFYGRHLINKQTQRSNE